MPTYVPSTPHLYLFLYGDLGLETLFSRYPRTSARLRNLDGSKTIKRFSVIGMGPRYKESWWHGMWHPVDLGRTPTTTHPRPITLLLSSVVIW